MIHELAIQQQVKVGGIPFHRPNVEGIGPGVTAQIGNGLGRERPFSVCFFWVPPTFGTP
jgi:hypothetical protein